MMSKKEETKQVSDSIKFEFACDLLDLIEEYTNRTEMSGTASGYELYGTPLHNYFLKMLKKQRKIVEGFYGDRDEQV